MEEVPTVKVLITWSFDFDFLMCMQFVGLERKCLSRHRFLVT